MGANPKVSAYTRGLSWLNFRAKHTTRLWMLHLGSRTSVQPVHRIAKVHQKHRLRIARRMCQSVGAQASQSKLQDLYRVAKQHLSGSPPSQDAAAEIAEALSELLGPLSR